MPPDEAVQAEEAEEQVGGPNTEALDEKLSEIFKSADEETTEAVEETAAEAVETAPEESEADALEELKNSLYYLRAENTLLKGRLDEVGKPPSVAPATPTEEFDSEAFNRAVSVDPGKAINDLIKTTVEKALKGTVEGLRKETDGKLQATTQREQQRQSDQTRTIADYGTYLNNVEFRNMASAIYDELTGDDEWRPGAMYTAASVAFAKMAKAGKINLDGKAKLSVVPKPKKPADQMLGEDSKAKGPGSALEGEFNPAELRSIDKMCSDWGITRKDYLKYFEAERKKDPSFGKKVR